MLYQLSINLTEGESWLCAESSFETEKSVCGGIRQAAGFGVD